MVFATSQVIVFESSEFQEVALDWEVTLNGPEESLNVKVISLLADWPPFKLLSLTFTPNFIVLLTDGNTSQALFKSPAITVFWLGKCLIGDVLGETDLKDGPSVDVGIGGAIAVSASNCSQV